MVRKNIPLSKSAFTMIELIFAIVIIAISVLSLPMVTQITSKGIENSFAQEAIFAASAELNQALSYKWDGNSQEVFGQLSKAICGAGTRPGHVHRMCLNDTTVSATLTAGVDDANQSDYSINNAATTYDINIFTPGSGSSSGYKENYTMGIDVTFAAFGTTTAADKDIKKIEITVKKLNTSTSTYEDYVVLRTFSANIGESEAFKRVL